MYALEEQLDRVPCLENKCNQITLYVVKPK